MVSINKIARTGVLGALLMGSVALKATNPITNVNKTPNQNQTEIVSKEGAEALKSMSLQGVNQAEITTVHNQRIDNTFRKFANDAEVLNQINTIIKDVYNDYGTFAASAQLQHELDRQQLYLLLNQDTNTLNKLNSKLAKEVKEIGPAFYNGVKNNDVNRITTWLDDEYSPSLIGLLSFDHKPTAKEVIAKIDTIAEKKVNFNFDNVIDYHVFSDGFKKTALGNKTDDLSLSELIAYKIFIIDKIIMEKSLKNSNFFGKNSFFSEHLSLESYYEDWMNTVSPDFVTHF